MSIASAPSAAVRTGDGGKQYVTAQLGGVLLSVYESLVEDGRVVVDVDADGAPLAITVNDNYVFGGPAADLPPVPVNESTHEGRAIAALFASCQALGDDWNGGDVVQILADWFTALGLDTQPHA